MTASYPILILTIHCSALIQGRSEVLAPRRSNMDERTLDTSSSSSLLFFPSGRPCHVGDLQLLPRLIMDSIQDPSSCAWSSRRSPRCRYHPDIVRLSSLQDSVSTIAPAPRWLRETVHCLTWRQVILSRLIASHDSDPLSTYLSRVRTLIAWEPLLMLPHGHRLRQEVAKTNRSE